MLSLLLLCCTASLATETDEENMIAVPMSSITNSTLFPSSTAAAFMRHTTTTNGATVGNGYLATFIGSDTFYISGLFSGANYSAPSHRAALPSVLNVFPSIASASGARHPSTHALCEDMFFFDIKRASFSALYCIGTGSTAMESHLCTASLATYSWLL